MLMASVRGQHKNPGNFRKDQNWIGPYNCPFEKATFDPPSHLILEKDLRYWENYLKLEDFDLLAQSAIYTCSFKDGNGWIEFFLKGIIQQARKIIVESNS